MATRKGINVSGNYIVHHKSVSAIAPPKLSIA